MSLGVKFTTFAAALVLAGSAFAMEESCPRLNAIQAKGISSYQQLAEKYYAGYSISTYNSSSNWIFAIGPVGAETPEEALDMSNDLLKGMSSEGQVKSDMPLVCEYETGNMFIKAVAVRDDSLNPMQLKQYLHVHK
jgi:hypothetical protein